jgi:hypothetical protein
VFGAVGPSSFDCSGLVQFVYKKFGLTTPRTTSDMMGSKSNLQSVTRAQLQPGDLIFSNWEGQPSSHVGIYNGSGSIIEAPQPGQNVKVTTLGPNYWAHVDNIRRVPGTNGSAPPGLIAQIGAGIGAANSMIAGWIPTPGNVTDALSNVGNAMGSVAQSAVGVGKFAELATRAFLPSNLLRGTAFLFGTVFLLIGIWFLAREIKESS